MSDLIEITDEERDYLSQLAEWEQNIHNLGYAKLARSLATRKPASGEERAEAHEQADAALREARRIAQHWSARNDDAREILTQLDYIASALEEAE